LDISSRYDKADEIVELIGFAQRIAEKKVTPYVKRAFYDSKANLCSIELAPTVHEGDAVADAIFEAATQTITQFVWFDIVEHGVPAEKFYSGRRKEAKRKS
jgi:hypothetical protein